MRLKTLALLLCIGTCQFLLTACGGSARASSTPLAGNWQMVLQNGTSSRSQSGFLLQSGNSLTGQLLLSGNCAGVGTVQGPVKGSSVAISVNQTAQTVGLTGSATGDDSSMSGNYSILGSGCGSSEVGTWTGTRVNSLTGSFQGAFTSSVSGVPAFAFTGTLTQGANTGASNATISGSMTSTNASCFTTASISGLISGTSVVLNLVSSDGIALGQYKGTATADATTVAGTYDFFNAQTPTLTCPGGDFGTATLTVQSSM